MALIETEEAARRLASTIVSDLVLYHEEKINQGIIQDNLFDILMGEIAEGRALYYRRVSPSLHGRNFYNRALIDILIKSRAHLPSRLW